MYRYETHMHTSPVSKCAKADVWETLRFYREKGYDGVFLTNHFLDGNINISPEKSYGEKLDFYLSDYTLSRQVGAELGLKVFFGVELSYGGTDFLIYGLPPAWYAAHPEIMELSKREELEFMRREGALVIQAHPCRSAHYIDHIRLYPQSVDGVEVLNACRTELENRMAALYAENYGLLRIAGSDNHVAGEISRLAGIETEAPLQCEEDFIQAVRNHKTVIFQEVLRSAPEQGK